QSRVSSRPGSPLRNHSCVLGSFDASFIGTGENCSQFLSSPRNECRGAGAAGQVGRRGQGVRNDPATVSKCSRDPLPYGSPLSFQTGPWTGRWRKGQKRIGGGAGDRPKERGRRVFDRRIGARGGTVGRSHRSFLQSNKARAEFPQRASGARD